MNGIGSQGGFWDSLIEQGRALRQQVFESRNSFQSAVSDARHRFERARRSFESALERAIDPDGHRAMESNRRRWQRARGDGPFSSGSIVDHVWEAFFDMMFMCVDIGLCEGWIAPDDLAEP
eukprot:CAMPEP_0113711446 /NCGR_PEP_ID=MMETSP0038_2-20120614/30763_1 /TAXON_ID=2898 /ORGANISM="Cryptomonas paramecium" /LENGTH=120 /DNA_ID=CAMNT_0000637707 /DNA_START=48 /DNA_END=407 /DNA_ORIENTATION=+ /assembly_acc=CAM_ASM_000170